MLCCGIQRWGLLKTVYLGMYFDWASYLCLKSDPPGSWSSLTRWSICKLPSQQDHVNMSTSSYMNKRGFNRRVSKLSDLKEYKNNRHWKLLGGSCPPLLIYLNWYISALMFQCSGYLLSSSLYPHLNKTPHLIQATAKRLFQSSNWEACYSTVPKTNKDPQSFW